MCPPLARYKSLHNLERLDSLLAKSGSIKHSG